MTRSERILREALLDLGQFKTVQESDAAREEEEEHARFCKKCGVFAHDQHWDDGVCMGAWAPNGSDFSEVEKRLAALEAWRKDLLLWVTTVERRLPAADAKPEERCQYVYQYGDARDGDQCPYSRAEHDATAIHAFVPPAPAPKLWYDPEDGIDWTPKESPAPPPAAAPKDASSVEQPQPRRWTLNDCRSGSEGFNDERTWIEAHGPSTRARDGKYQSIHVIELTPAVEAARAGAEQAKRDAKALERVNNLVASWKSFASNLPKTSERVDLKNVINDLGFALAPAGKDEEER